jgi:SNF2 family DNA or RNA helicase
LKAIARGDNLVRLADGTFGVLPEEWLKRYRVVAALGTADDGTLRFERSQAGLLDALLAEQPEVTFDETFDRIRKELACFGGVQSAEAAPTFQGKLREYQRDGLGWLRFLRRFGFGGCLADDMGLGKTVQLLALLDSAERMGPALIVVPRSLIFNWKQEAARFTPRLRLLDHTGMDRMSRWDEIHNADIVLTTYGTLRRDVVRLKDVAFDTIVLDEAQAIKNANTESAKAVRLLKARHRLALTGTPVENRLSDLWSLFDFLNPGLLGTASVFRTQIAGKNGGTETASAAENESLQMLCRALRPFLLRRTKEQVARELPPKTEQTIYCELDREQRRLYNELRLHYRDALLGRVDSFGIEKSRMQILEALLRLRQAACHPGLIDKERAGQSSAKIDALIPQIAELVAEGHKALLFSQFTSFLDIVKKRLDTDGLRYEYLDGRTRDREARVRRFQQDAGCPLFLISLKAGGVGLNLTAAEYVFLLDPWWNPAIEAQAIDRCHRIGQPRNVFAYRLIARDTVEEKILDLQKAKRDLANAIMTSDNSVLAGLTREHLELLLE